MIDINLLPARTVLSITAQRWQKNLTLAALVLGIVVAVVGGVLLGLERLVLFQVTNLSKSRQEQLDRFNANGAKLTKLLTLKDKITGIKRVQAVRPNLSTAVAMQQGIAVEGVSTSKLVVGADGNMNFNVLVRDTNTLSAYLTKLESSQVRDFFKSLAITGLRLEGDGGFSFSVSGQFDKDKLLTGKNSQL